MLCQRPYGYDAETGECTCSNFNVTTSIPGGCLRIGNKVRLGRFPQLASGGKRDVVWLIKDFDTEKRQILLVSQNVLLGKTFDSSSSRWDNSSLRAWLNDTSEDGFIGMTFTPNELVQIVEVELDNSQTNGGPVGGNTMDRVFLLDGTEFNMDASIGTCHFWVQSGMTEECIFNGDNAPWWLRIPGTDEHQASYVTSEGVVSSGDVTNVEIGIRPAIVIQY